MFMDLDYVSVHKNAKKELGQYPAILTSHLVNNPYILPKFYLLGGADTVLTVTANYLLTKSEVFTGKSQTETLWY